MSTIVVLGAGRSAYSLIQYLLQHAAEHQWHVTIADQSVEFLNQNFEVHPHLTKVAFNVLDESQRQEIVSQATVIISMLPASFHPLVAQTCLSEGKHLLTASYVSKEMKAMQEEVTAKGLLFLNEMGLDPGIDHLSAMKIIDELKAKGVSFSSFKSYTGGLVAPESDNNPWNYKFTWNPRNVVLAGQGVAKYIEKGQYKYLPYHRLFKQTNTYEIPEYGSFEGYPNRDSLQYRGIYGLSEIPTMLRGTFRRAGYCKSWDHFVQLGLTDDSYTIGNSSKLTYRSFINTFLPYSATMDLE